MRRNPRLRVTLYRNGRRYAIGSVEVSEGRATFYPKNHKPLDVSPNDKIKLQVKKTKPLLLLRVPEVILDGSASDSIWDFELDI